MTFILSIAASGKGKGVDMKSGEFFRHARILGLWPDAEAIHRSALTKARKKVDWRIFRQILDDAVGLAYECWPKSPKDEWHGMSTHAIDGSDYTLPAADELRAEFDPESGLGQAGKGHYPQCLVCTLYDVFRRLPIARTVVPVNSSERDQAKHLLPLVPEGSVLLLDRGYPGYEFLSYLLDKFKGYFVIRCPATSTFATVKEFIRSGKSEAEIVIPPTSNYLSQVTAEQRKAAKPIRVRVIRLSNPDGTLSVLLTNLYDKVEFPRQEITDLYFRRWEIESYFRDEKIGLEIEKFHGKTCNSVLQELFAAAIMAVISRTLMAISTQLLGGELGEPQFKNAVMTLASEAAVLAADDPERAIEIFQDILKEIYRVKYYRPNSQRPPQPRVNKQSKNKWLYRRYKNVPAA
ncbi:IS4 family transposase [Desulfomonile tiedjei]|uniref:IS4 family transposase n=1 Tax=Desulfomonile tiedjei TaxID=2358 RepID=UPI001F02A4E5|nr:IS4 family transposase [Desulfomonile tiedjei]